MPFIQNIDYIAAKNGEHLDPGPNSMLIQIVDVHIEDCPVPSYPFKEIHRFAFLDCESRDDVLSEFGMKNHHAVDIAALLTRALAEDTNVIVHCIAGLCRSGAVVECGVQIGFDDTGMIRQPNVTVKNAILKQLGLGFDPDESPLNDWRNLPVWE